MTAVQSSSSIFKDVKDNLGAGFAASSEDSVPGCSREAWISGQSSCLESCPIAFFQGGYFRLFFLLKDFHKSTSRDTQAALKCHFSGTDYTGRYELWWEQYHAQLYDWNQRLVLLKDLKNIAAMAQLTCNNKDQHFML